MGSGVGDQNRNALAQLKPVVINNLTGYAQASGVDLYSQIHRVQRWNSHTPRTPPKQTAYIPLTERISESSISLNNELSGMQFSEEEQWSEILPPVPEVETNNASSLENSMRPNESIAEEFEFAVAIYDFPGEREGDLNFNEGDVIEVVYKGTHGWWTGRIGEDMGYFPASYVTL